MGILEIYFEYLNTQISADSVKGYIYDTNGYVKFLYSREGITEHCDKNSDLVLCEANEADLYAYVNYLKNELCNSYNAINRKISSLRKLYEYLYNKKIVPKNIALGLSKLNYKDSKYESDVLSLNECKRLLDSVNGRNADRDLLIIMMFLFCGATVNDVLNIKIDDIHENMITFRENEKIKKILPINEALKSILSDFLNDERINTAENLFTTSTGKPLSKRAVQQIISKRLENAGLNQKGATSELIRKSGAKLLADKNAGLSEIQYYLGHKNISSTTSYIDSLNMIGKDTIDKNPLANYKK